jgi:hypothetical protein
MYLQEDEPSSIVMVRLDKSDSRCNVRLKSIVAKVYSCPRFSGYRLLKELGHTTAGVDRE